MQLWQKKMSKTWFFYITQRGFTPKTQVYQSHCDHDFYAFKHLNTVTLFIVKPVAGIATELTINYAKFAPLNVWNFAPLPVFIMLR